MPKKLERHDYSDKQAFERLLIAIATIIKYPGIGCQQEEKEEGQAHEGLQEVQEKMREIAADLGRSWDEDYPAVSTIRKDFQTLKDYLILDRRMYRWGYYLGTGGLDLNELSYALDALTSQAKYQADHLSKKIVQRVTRRLKGLNLERHGHLLYPIRQQIDSSIVYTDPIEMRVRQTYRETLFEKLEMLEAAILGRQTIEINRVRDPFGRNLGQYRVIPLQIIYSNIAWYLIGQTPDEKGHLFTTRLDRHSDYLQIIHVPTTKPNKKEEILKKQQENLNKAHQLLHTGWGLNLGSPEEQQAELNNKLEFIPITVRFWGEVIPFIKEGEKRHPSQQIKDGKKDDYGKPKYVDYCVKLPPRSVNEFMFWVYRFMDSAQVIEPDYLVENQRKKAQAILDLDTF
jgi:hypothetical protein